MVTVSFTANLRRHLNVASVEVPGATVREVLDAVFAEHPAMRSYLLDDQNTVRKHVTIFVNGEPIDDREDLSDALPDGADVYVAQALSGG